MTRAEILDCLTDRPCDSCRFHESGRCERWDCVFEEKPDDAEDCEDAISRQAVMCVLDEIGSDFDSLRNAVVSIDGVADAIQDLPSVTPAQKMGRWEFQKIKYGEYLAPMRIWCSNCDSAFDICCNQIKRYNKATGDDDMWTYCPWCGAKMAESEVSE